MSATFPSVAIQTYLTFTAKRWGQFPTISFTNGATAGQEVVTVASDLSSITIQIQSGTTTMLQVKNAITATAGSANGLSAGDLVSVAITAGHNSDAVYTVNQAVMAGGTVAKKAKLTAGHMVYTAKTAGTAGNSIRIKYTSGASLLVSVSTNDITIRLKNDGTTTNTAIAAAVAADNSANALVGCTSDGLAMSFIPTVAMASSFTNLTGGVDATGASVVVEDITITSLSADTTGNGKTVTYATGATAGAEVVTVDGSGNVSVQIENGVSTATQVNTALGSSTDFTALYTSSVSGTGSNAQKTVNAAAMTGAVGVNSLSFYVDDTITALTNSFVYFPFTNRFTNFEIYNDETSGSKAIIFSLDGNNVSGELLPTESASLRDVNASGVYLKYGTGAPVYRFFATGAR